MPEIISETSEIVKHQKKKPSNHSKASRKADHRHDYEACLVNIRGSGTVLWQGSGVKYAAN